MILNRAWGIREAEGAAYTGGMVIDGYVTELERVLVGPPRVKRDMVVEARDSLLDAAEALQARGLSREEAERRAVAEFGTIEEVAPGYQEELTACAGRRLGWVLLLVGPLTWLLWWGIWRVFPGDAGGWTQPPEWYAVVARVLDGTQLFTGAVGGVLLLALGRFGRTVRRTRLVTRAAAIYAKALLPVTLGLCVPLLYGAGPVGAHMLPWAVAAVVSLLLLGVQMRHAVRCLRLVRLAPAA